MQKRTILTLKLCKWSTKYKGERMKCLTLYLCFFFHCYSLIAYDLDLATYFSPDYRGYQLLPTRTLLMLNCIFSVSMMILFNKERNEWYIIKSTHSTSSYFIVKSKVSVGFTESHSSFKIVKYIYEKISTIYFLNSIY